MVQSPITKNRANEGEKSEQHCGSSEQHRQRDVLSDSHHRNGGGGVVFHAEDEGRADSPFGGRAERDTRETGRQEPHFIFAGNARLYGIEGRNWKYRGSLNCDLSWRSRSGVLDVDYVHHRDFIRIR